MLTKQDILLSRFQRVLHEVASASLKGFLYMLLPAILLTSFTFNLMNQWLDRTMDWPLSFAMMRKDLAKPLNIAARAADPTLSAKATKRASSKRNQSAFQLFRKLNDLEGKYRKDGAFQVVTDINKLSYKAEKSSKSIPLRPPGYTPPRDVVFIQFSRGESQAGCENDESCNYKQAHAILAVEYRPGATRFLRALLWVVMIPVKSPDPQWFPSQPKQLLFFEQSKWSIGLQPTRSLGEPNEAGRWLIQNFKNLLKDQMHASSLMPDKEKCDLVAPFIGALLTRLLVAKKSALETRHQKLPEEATLTEQTFWITFMNGADAWGMIQWLSALISSFIILMLLARFWLVSTEVFVFQRWTYLNLDEIQQKILPADPLIQIMRVEVIRNEMEMPQPRLIAAMRHLDPERESEESAEQIDSDFVQVRLESSQRIVDFFINSLASIGFIGTITGIAFAINQAYKVVTPDEFLRIQAIKSLSTSLALAFSTTFVALVLSLVCEAIARRQWRKEDQMLEAFVRLYQAWSLQSGDGSYLQQVSNTIVPKEFDVL